MFPYLWLALPKYQGTVKILKNISEKKMIEYIRYIHR